MSAPHKYCDDPDSCTYSDCPTAFCDKGKHSLAAMAGSGATWKHKRGGKGEAAWQKWVSDELKAWVTWWKANPSVVHYGSNATYRGTMKATPDQAMREIEMRQNEKLTV